MTQSLPSFPSPSSAAWLLPLASLLGVSACSEPAPPPAEAAVSIAKSISDEPGFQSCPTPHGALMFPSQMGTTVLNASTPESVVSEMTTIDGGVDCTVKDNGGSYAVNIDIEQDTVGGVGLFQLTNASLQGEFGNGNVYWLYQGFGFRGMNCGVNVDRRPPSEENPDGLFIEPGMAKLTFECDPFTNSEGQACIGRGTVFVRECKK